MDSLELQLKTEEIMQEEVNPMVKRAHEIKIKNDEESANATEFVKQIKKKKKEIDEVLGLTEQTKSAHKAWKHAKDRENEFLVPFDDAEEIIKSEIKSYETKKFLEQRKIEEERRKQEEALIAKGEEKKPSPMPEDIVIKRSSEPTKKMAWKGRVTDVKALCQSIVNGDLSENIIEINIPNLNRLAKTLEGSKQIAGVEFYEEADIRIR